MTIENHPVDVLLRAAIIDPVPSPADTSKVRAALTAAIVAEQEADRAPTPPQRRKDPLAWLRWAPAAGFAAAVLIAVVVVTGLLSPEPVTALAELAAVAEQREPISVDQGEYAYTSVSEVATFFLDGADIGLAPGEVVSYQLVFDRERWRSRDGLVFERTTVIEARFFDDDVEAAYAANDYGVVDGVGLTTEVEYVEATTPLDQRVWPTDPEALLAAMRSQVSSEGNPIPESAALVELASALLRETGAEPELRAAVFQVLDELGLNVVTRSGGAEIEVGIDFTDTVPTRLELTFDAEANLVAERFTWIDGDADLGVPPGTVIQETRLLPSRTVDAIPGR